MEKALFRNLCEKKIVLLDGATGTELQKRGLPTGVCPEKWVQENPDTLIKLQKEYITAGSDIIYTCTFGANRAKLKNFGLDKNVFEINKTLAEISVQAVKESGGSCFVAGGLSPTGKLIYPFGDMAFEDIVDIYKEQVSGLLAGGIDLFVIETMITIQEARAALLAIRESCDLPVIVSITVEKNGKMLTGTDPLTALVTLQSLGADAVGLNCSSGPDKMITYLSQMKPYATVPLFVKPNAGLPVIENGLTKFNMTYDQFNSYTEKLIQSGTNLIGGCCGTDPRFIAAIKEKTQYLQPLQVQNKGVAIVSSATKTLAIDDAGYTLLIGERINPTGKKDLQEAIQCGDYDFIADMALDQKEEGADLLDINLGMESINETEAMKETINELSIRVDLPLCIDSTDPKAIEAALRLYQGRAIVNSITLEKHKIEQILPIAAKYGAMLILMPIGRGGIPKTFQERKEVIQELYAQAAAYGYQKKDVIIDGLVMSAFAAPDNMPVAMETIKWCRNDFGINTVIGLSNISFGLSDRRPVNAAFLSVAIYHGLTMAIADTSDKNLLHTKEAADLLRRFDC